MILKVDRLGKKDGEKEGRKAGEKEGQNQAYLKKCMC